MIFAYVVPVKDPQNESEKYSRRELKSFLKTFLPSYMIPSHIIELEKIPLTHNEKLDMQALPSHASIDRDNQVESTYVAPRTPVEVTLAKIWSEVLRVDVIGVDDNFFELGGDSIISIKVVSKARESGIGISLKQIFEYPTISDLSKQVKAVADFAHKQERLTGVLPNFPIQHWFFETSLNEPHHFNQAEFLSVPPSVSSSVLKKAFDALIEHHDILRVTCKQTDGLYEQFFRDEVKDVDYFEVVDVKGDFEQDFKRKIEQAQASLSLTSGLLMKVVHFTREAGDNYLLVTIHHLAVDGVSWRILLEDLELAVSQLTENKVCHPFSISYFCRPSLSP